MDFESARPLPPRKKLRRHLLLLLFLGMALYVFLPRLAAIQQVAGYGVPQLLGKATLILGGAGLVETGMVALYVILGVPKPTAIIAVLGYRLLSSWLPTLLGVGLVAILGAREQQLEPTHRPRV